MKRLGTHRLCIGVVFALVAAFVAPPLFAQRAQEEPPKMPIERLKKDLGGIAAHYRNSKTKIGHDMSGASPSRETDERPLTPAEACCGSNLDRITEKIQSMIRTSEQLFVYYTERRDSEALTVVETIRVELHAVARGFAAFKLQQDTGSSQAALAGILKPFNRLREAIDQLEACCPVDPAVWAEPAGG